MNLQAMKCHVDLITGDVANAHDVQKAFELSKHTVRGIIQAAMVLNVSHIRTLYRAHFAKSSLILGPDIRSNDGR